jgi:two-component system, response regulator RegA
MEKNRIDAPGVLVEAPSLLLVEDDAALRTMLRAALEMQDFVVFDTGQRQDVLAILKDAPEIGIVLLDLGLPPRPHETDEGIAVIRDIRQACFPVKIIVLTGQDQDSAALEAIHAGAFDFLAKPASIAAIVQAIDRASLFLRKERELGAAGIAQLQITTSMNEGLKAVRDEAEEKLVRTVLQETNFNVYQSARRLGVKRESIYYFLKKFGIQREE